MSDNEKPQFEPARTTLALNSQQAPSADPMQADEVRMRRALGLWGDQPRPRPPQERNDPPPRPVERFPNSGHHKRRFVHDGEVPVTLVHGLAPGRREHAEGNGTRGGNGQPTNRLEVAEAALAAEIATRERIERALQEAQATIHDLQTKLGHADLARQEAVETLRRERDAMAELRASAEAAEDRVAAAQAAQAAAEQRLETLRARIAEPADPIVPPPPRRRGRKPRALAPAESAGVATRTVAKPVTKATAKPAAKAAAKTAKPPKAATRGRGKPAAAGRNAKPIRWWVAPRAKKKR